MFSVDTGCIVSFCSRARVCAQPSHCLLLLLPPQPYVPTEEEQMAPLPPNPFSELSERELEDYRKNVERRTLGLPGTTHTPKDTHTDRRSAENPATRLTAKY